MILTREAILDDRDLQIAREMELDPDFEPCRDERCERVEIHRAHRFAPSRANRDRTECPRCAGEVLYTHSDGGRRAHCSSCSWRGHFTRLDKAKGDR